MSRLDQSEFPVLKICATPARTARREAFDQARRKWPAINLNYQQFSEHLLRLGYTETLPSQPSSVYLCLGCSLALPAACAALEAGYFPRLRHAVSRIDTVSAEDVLQQVRDRLLVGQAPKIGTYRGDGLLTGWLRVVAVNTALDCKRTDRARWQHGLGLRDAAVVEDLKQRGRATTPEDLAFRGEYVRICDRALRGALRSLAAGERRLIYHYFFLGRTVDVLGRIYSIDRSTAARRIQRALAAIRRRLKVELSSHFPDLAEHELSSVVGALYDELDLSASDLLPEEHQGIARRARDDGLSRAAQALAPQALAQKSRSVTAA